MKKIILLSLLMPLIAVAGNTKENNVIAVYQELCAKEHDPVKRQNYCYMLERNGHSETLSSIFREDIAIV
ncbi:MAG: hypothetical protein Q8M03_10155 [Legionella sp.]|nr:hypothetical protein [Legionella sp.]